jgi:putative membrane protein
MHPNLLSLYFKEGFMVVAYSISYTVSEIIPLIFLSIPSDEYVLSLSPAQRYLRTGRAAYAVRMMLKGMVLCFLFFIPFYFLNLTPAFSFFEKNSFYFLFFITLFSVLHDGALGIVLFLISGAFGFFTLRLPINNNYKIFAILSGLFSIPSLLHLKDYRIKKESRTSKGKPLSEMVSPSLLGFIAGSFTAFFPSLSSSISTFFVTKFKTFRPSDFLITNASVSISSMLFSLLVLSETGKARNGALIGLTLSKDEMFLSALLSFVISATLVYAAVSFISERLQDLSLSKVKYISLFVLFLSTYLLGGAYNLLLLLTSSALGLLPLELKVKRTNLMGVLIVPTLWFLYLFRF